MTMHSKPEAMPLTLTVNGVQRNTSAPPAMRLSELLREGFGLTGTKVGCDAGDCGACTVSLDGRQVCACLIPAAQADGSAVATVEGLADTAIGRRLQASFHAHGAAQCGICTPGMLMAAADLLARTPEPTRVEAMDALGGVLCRCTGYEKIVDAVVALSASQPDAAAAGAAVGARIAKLDGLSRLDGTALYGADAAPEGRCGCAPSARRTPAPASALAISMPGPPRVRASPLSSRRATFRGTTASASIPTSRTSPSSPRARCATGRGRGRHRRREGGGRRHLHGRFPDHLDAEEPATGIAAGLAPIRRSTHSGPTMC